MGEARKSGGAWRVFAGVDGAALRVTCALDQLVVLKTGATAGCRLRPAVSDMSGPAPAPVKLAGMDWRDAERVDLAVTELAPAVLEGQPPTQMLVIPASFSSLSSHRGRRLLVERVAGLGGDLRRIAVEIRDLRGVPSSRLAEVIALIRPACHVVLGEVEADRADIAAVTSCGLQGLSVRPRRDWTVDQRLIDQFTALGELARRITPIAITRAFTPETFVLLAAAGFTHATIGADQMRAQSAAAA